MAASAPPKEPRDCARPGCPHRFVPSRKDQVYCSATCKSRFQAYRHVLKPRQGH